mmetsp:Transcript_22244/g.29774  ORF Transcript_22244/g.29774 Transcript_22244/m.29774 type:complete len:137 (+) Transcript_22244:1047-1457(+)
MAHKELHARTKQQRIEMKQNFIWYDINNDAKMNKDEFMSAFKRVYPTKEESAVEERAHAIFAEADLDSCGEIDFNMWCKITVDKALIEGERKLRAVFNLYDEDGSGTVDVVEIAKVLGKDMLKNDDAWDELIDEVD